MREGSVPSTATAVFGQLHNSCEGPKTTACYYLCTYQEAATFFKGMRGGRIGDLSVEGGYFATEEFFLRTV